ncbi:MAG: hypothetical protein EA402_07440 [Planctomycetota bacterium]|nr:MAG: hypothetical protein EA402_07440 [Planctomycetota bacterium]
MSGIWRVALLCSLWALVALGAVENEVVSVEDLDDAFRQQRREAAAAFRVRYREVAGSLDAEYHAAARAGYEAARELMVAGQFRAARRSARRTYRAYPFAHDAPRLAHLLMRLHAATGSPVEARRWLVDLWERYPGYADIEQALNEALTAAVVLRDAGLTVDLMAEHPRDALKVRDLGKVLAANSLFRFLSVHGDRQEHAPMALLGLARSLLAEGGRKKVFEARLAYDDFLLAYSQHPLVFDALIELAISHLVTYRGPRFDVGVIIDATHIIDQAELYTQERPERVAIVSHYRRMIRGWHQDRDFYAAEWYRDHRQWDAARYYYEWVVRRDPASPQGQQAATLIEGLPSDTIDEPRMRIKDWIRK